MRKPLLAVLATCSAWTIFACSSSSSDTAPAPDASVDATAGDASADGASDGAADSSGADASSGPGVGSVTLGSTDLGYQGAAAFFVGSDPFGACPSTTVAGCTVTPLCTPDAGAAVPASAGTITVSGGKITPPLMLVPKSDGTYPYPGGTPTAFAGGDMMTVSAAGAEVAAFNVTLAAPAHPQLTTPMIAGDGGTSLDTITIDRSQPFAVAWTATPDGQLRVTLGSAATVVTCDFPASAGSAMVPSAALMMLQAGAGGGLGISGYTTKSIDGGRFATTVTISAFDSNLSPKHLRANVTFQ